MTINSCIAAYIPLKHTYPGNGSKKNVVCEMVYAIVVYMKCNAS